MRGQSRYPNSYFCVAEDKIKREFVREKSRPLQKKYELDFSTSKRTRNENKENVSF